MQVGTDRDFTIGKRTYRDTLIGQDVHQISNPATGHVYGNVVSIPPSGRKKGYYLAGADREECTTWEAAVQAARAQNPDPSVVVAAPTPVAVAAPLPGPPELDTTGWLTCKAAEQAYGLSRSTLNKQLHTGAIQAIKRPGPTGPRWLVAPPPAKAAPTPPKVARPRKVASKPAPPVEPAAVAAAEIAAPPEPKVIVRPAGTKLSELEARIAALEAERRGRGPASFWARLFGAA